MALTAFYDTIYNLRSNGELTLYEKLLIFKLEDEKLVQDFLQIEYDTEAENFPGTPPEYDAAAALWGAKTIYTICQLILYRQDKVSELPALSPAYTGTVTAAAMVSADLCLRFLPQVLIDTRHIDPEDALIDLANMHLIQWHYSGIGYPLAVGDLNFEQVLSSPCLLQLYADRVIDKKDKGRCTNQAINEKVKGSMGLYGPQFWKEFNH